MAQAVAHPKPKKPAFKSALSLPRGVPPSLRQCVDEALERLAGAQQALIDYLDALDGDPDSEPSLGASEASEWHHDQSKSWRHPKSSRCDLEDEFDGKEPSLACPGFLCGNGTMAEDDLELDPCDDGEPGPDGEAQGDDEPSLGATNPDFTLSIHYGLGRALDQARWGHSSTTDMEHEHDGSESDGLDTDAPIAHGGVRGVL